MRLRSFLLAPLLISLSFSSRAQTDIWQISFSTMDHFNMNMKYCRGRKILIYAFDSTNFTTANILALDSLNRRINNFGQVIGVPINGFNASIENAALLYMINSLQVSFPIAGVWGESQTLPKNPLLLWLLTSSPKNHYRITTINAGNIFIISSEGILYAVLPPGTPLNGKNIADILNKEADE